jgi:hypothetical protein
MGSCCTPDAPPPPNPFATAAAQTGTNVSTAIANSYLGNVNQKTAQGNLSFSPDKLPAYKFNDPVTGTSYEIPRWTAEQTLTDAGQKTFDQSQQAQVNMSGMAMDQTAALRGLLGTPFNAAAGAPPPGDPNALGYGSGPQEFFGGQGSIQNNYASGGQIQDSYGPQDNYSADRSRIEQSMYERVNPQLQQDEQRLRQQLADQGIRYGSQAYQGAYDPYNRQVTDTRLGIVAAGGAEQQRMNEMARNQAMFGNQAQAQREGQNAARAAFGNQAQQTGYEQALGRGTFFNQAQNQLLGRNSAIVNAQNQSRNQYLQEQYQARTQPINEITALLSGSQVSQPNFINAAKTQIPTTDVAGLINQNFAQQNDIYKTQSSQWSDMMGGILGAGGKIGSAALMSDVRAKENIAPMGSVMTTRGELPMYEYDYKAEHDDGRRHFGPMAQDVERLDPKAVKTIGGLKHIKTDKLASIFGSA